MRVLLYADFRNSHSQGWLAGLTAAGIHVRAVSSQLVADSPDISMPQDPLSRIRKAVVESGLNSTVRAGVSRVTKPGNRLGGGSDPLQILETVLTPMRYPRQAAKLRSEVERFRPDLVHALRIPYEGVIALSAVPESRVVVSSWGQDFLRQAASDPILRSWIRRVLPRTSGLHVDALADLNQAVLHGFRGTRPVLHAAGNFGVDPRLFRAERRSGDKILVLYPRGMRPYVNHRIFLSMAEALSSDDRFVFVGVGLKGDAESEQAASRLGGAKLSLTGNMQRADFARLMRSASVVVSPALSDGTPNTLLEALSCGSFIMAGDIPSVSALLENTCEASLLDPEEPTLWAESLLEAVDSERISRALEVNPDCVPSEYSYEANLSRVPAFYDAVLEAS